MLLHRGQNQLRVPTGWIVGPVGLGLNEGFCAIQPLHRAQDERHGAFRIELIDVGVCIYIRKSSRSQVCGSGGGGILAQDDRRDEQYQRDSLKYPTDCHRHRIGRIITRNERIPLLAEEGWRDSRRLTRRGGQFGSNVSPGLTTPSAPSLARRSLPSSARRGMRCIIPSRTRQGGGHVFT